MNKIQKQNFRFNWFPEWYFMSSTSDTNKSDFISKFPSHASDLGFIGSDTFYKPGSPFFWFFEAQHLYPFKCSGDGDITIDISTIDPHFEVCFEELSIEIKRTFWIFFELKSRATWTPMQLISMYGFLNSLIIEEKVFSIIIIACLILLFKMKFLGEMIVRIS